MRSTTLQRFALQLVAASLLACALGELGAADDADPGTFSLRDLPDEGLAMPHEPLGQETAAWLRAGNVAAFAGLRRALHVDLAVNLNLVFVGFDGDGAQGTRLGHATLQRWFEHLDHLVENVAFDDMVPADLQEHEPPASPVRFRVKYRVMRISPAVRAVVERVLRSNLRPEQAQAEPHGESQRGRDGAEERLQYYVDAHQMAQELRALLDAVGGADSGAHAYTLFILNPNRAAVLPAPAVGATYGYRAGFSPADLSTLLTAVGAAAAPPALRHLRLDSQLPLSGQHGTADVAALRALVDRVRERLPGKARGGTGEDPVVERAASPLASHAPGAARARALEWADAVRVSETWANGTLARLQGVATLDLLEAAVAVLEGSDAHRRLALLQGLRAQRRRDREARGAADSEGGRHHAHWQTGGQADCIVDAWVAQDRFAWLDLAAGPFAWGPAVGGTGLRTAGTVPRPPLPPQAAMTAVASAEEEAAARAAALKREAKLVQTLLEASCGAQAAGDEAQCGALRERRERVEAAQGEALAAAAAAERGDEAAAATLRERAKELARAALHFHSHADPHADEADGEGGSATQATDMFLAKLGAVVWKFLRHVVLPASSAPLPVAPTWDFGHRHDEAPEPGMTAEALIKSDLRSRHISQRHRVAAAAAASLPPVHAFAVRMPAPADQVHFPETLAYQLYIVTNHRAFEPLDVASGGLDLQELKEQLLLLALPNQRVSFNVQRLAVEEDAALAVALASSLRSAVVPSITSEGRFVASQRRYIDSAAAVHQLKELGAKTQATRAHVAAASTREIPIFLFSLDSDVPVLVDQSFQARAAGGFVVAAQSDHTRWSSHMSCGGKALEWNLRDPTRAIVGAAATAAGGLLRTHLTMEEGSQVGALQDWTWSLGVSPYAITSSCAALSLFHVDAAHRLAAAEALAASAVMVNSGVHALQTYRTTTRNEALLEAVGHRLADLRAAQQQLASAWRQVAEDSEALDFVAATARLPEMLRRSREFMVNAHEVADELSPFGCMEELSPASNTLPYILAGAIVSLSVCLVLALRTPTVPKPKVN